MPVRIVLRGLILMHVESPDQEPRKPDQKRKPDHERKITAKLINGMHAGHPSVEAAVKKHMMGVSEKNEAMRTKMAGEHRNHLHAHAMQHEHKGEIQIFDGTNDQSAPIDLQGDVDITIDTDEYVSKQPSYDRFMPNLGKIADNSRPQVRWLGEGSDKLVSHTVTVNRGAIRVRDIGDWDAGSPLVTYREADEVYQPAKVRFVKASVEGYVATECVIDVENTNTVTINGRSYEGTMNPSRRVAPNTVEILITNYAVQQRKPAPWTLHYRWMFEAAGYREISMSGEELDALDAFAREYDAPTWEMERGLFLNGDEACGFPFPYRTPRIWRAPLGQLEYNNDFDPARLGFSATNTPPHARPAVRQSDPSDPVRCPMADCSDGRC